ncbi:MAG: hypothetical protein ACOZQL_17950 [Myxococcota bacterium]
MKRATLSLCCLALAGCNGQFKPETLVDALRVLAITAEPPEVRPGESAQLDILQMDPSRPTGKTTVVWVGCEPDPIDFNRSACNDTSALLQPTAFATFPPGVRLLGFGTRAGYASGSGLFDGLSPEDPVRQNGTSGPVLGVVIGEEINPTSSDAELRELFGRIERQEIQTVMALTRVTVTERAERNHNPKLAALELDGVAVPKNAKLQLREGAKVTLVPRLADGSRETYRLVLPSGTEERSEKLVASWYSTSGRFDQARVDVSEPAPTTFIVPGSSEVPDDVVPEKRTGSIWLVVRDGRGGQAFESYPFYVCDGSPTPTLTTLEAPTAAGDPLVAKGTAMAGTLDLIIGGVAVTRGSYSPARDAFIADVPTLPPGTYPVQLRSKNCAVVDTGLTWTTP